MKDIIEQIIEIDSLAFQNKKMNEEYLKNKRQEYENKIIEYRKSMLENAKQESEKIVSQISDVDYKKALEEKANINTDIEVRYSQIEDKMVKIIFNKLFAKYLTNTLDATKTLCAEHSLDATNTLEDLK